MSKKIIIKWLGHSCFKVISDNYAVLFDPYEPGYVPGLRPVDEVADMVICSHEHHDHCYRKGVKIKTPEAQNPFNITAIDCYHDDASGSLRGENRITIIETAGIRVAHFGDIGCELTKKQLTELGPLDVALIPVGGYYTIDALGAKKLIESIKPRIIIPMHYRDDKAGFGFKEIGTVDEFARQFSKDEVVFIGSDTIEIDKGTKKQVAILDYD